jgi:hypothetical protein
VPPIDTVGLEVGMVQGKNIAEVSCLGKYDQRSVGEVHGPIRVFLHQSPHASAVLLLLIGDLQITVLYQSPQCILGDPSACSPSK